ncbi:hypothetical protein I9W82_005116 [Candida metapsilosis]|uniref:Uncharacterized protein n=1 Tax=Candida metapsilosis TaxID=273372 RepID=A0A8H7ZEP4_9ASCO|nr:hypothetical protein I9W82_005116 [Candida metapsilosis]
MTDLSKGIDTKDQFQSTSDNVDEMFEKLSVPEIQRLSSQYTTIIASTKDELHSLVSQKYRDLIKIAEDIGDLRSKSSTIEDDLHEISYKPSTFVPPYKDSYTKFESILRDQNAVKAQHNSRSVIVRNIIQKRLAKLANKVTCAGPSPLLHTSNFIPFVKELYTIETVFQDVLKQKRDLQLQVNNIKQQLLDYFEYEISVYNFPLTSFNSNDKFSLRQRFLEKDFKIDPNLKFTDDVSFIDDEFDDFQDGDDEDDEDEDEAQNKHERFDKLDTFKPNNYNRNVSAMCNYLVCVTIMSNGKSSSEDIKYKLMDLRIGYLNKLLTLTDGKNHLINYRSVLLYLENTCSYLKQYFGDASGSDYYRTLRDVAKPWSLVELVGHKGWIQDIQVDLGEVDVKAGSQVSLKDFDSVMDFISKLVLSPFRKPPTTDDLTTSMTKYYNFILNLKKLDDATKLVGSQSQLIQLVSKSSLLIDMSKNLELIIKGIYESHISKLMSEKGLLGSAQGVLDISLNQTGIHEVFDAGIVNLMDYNLDEYMNLVLGNGKQVERNSYRTTHQLKQWLNESHQLRRITDFGRDTSVSIRGKRDIYDYLPQIYHSLHTDDITWGEFSASSLKERFQTLDATSKQNFNQEISNFCAWLLKMSLDESEVSKLIYLIGLLSCLRDDIKSHNSESNTDSKGLLSTIESNIDKIFQKVVSQVLDNKVDELRKLVMAKDALVDEVDIPTRPNPQLASKMHELAQTFLTEATRIEAHNVNLFSTSLSTSEHFIKAKNEWFEKMLESIVAHASSPHSPGSASIDDKDGSTNNNSETASKVGQTEDVDVKSKVSESNGNSAEQNESENSATASTSQIATNTAFLQLFYKPSIDATGIKKTIDSIHSSTEQTYNDNTLEIISSGVTSFYKTRKNVYLPLSS